MSWREEVVAVAISLCGTPFHMNAGNPSVGMDCGRFPHYCYAQAGIEVPELPPHWPRDFMCHRMADSEPYLNLVLTRFDEVEEPSAGDLALFRPLRSNCYSHAGIVIAWPQLVHARGIGTRPKVEIASALDWPFHPGDPVRFLTPHV